MCRRKHRAWLLSSGQRRIWQHLVGDQRGPQHRPRLPVLHSVMHLLKRLHPCTRGRGCVQEHPPNLFYLSAEMLSPSVHPFNSVDKKKKRKTCSFVIVLLSAATLFSSGPLNNSGYYVSAKEAWVRGADESGLPPEAHQSQHSWISELRR